MVYMFFLINGISLPCTHKDRSKTTYGTVYGHSTGSYLLNKDAMHDKGKSIIINLYSKDKNALKIIEKFDLAKMI
jgi:hypothetical protein